jgi:hypothetical protein
MATAKEKKSFAAKFEQISESIELQLSKGRKTAQVFIDKMQPQIKRQLQLKYLVRLVSVGLWSFEPLSEIQAKQKQAESEKQAKIQAKIDEANAKEREKLKSEIAAEIREDLKKELRTEIYDEVRNEINSEAEKPGNAGESE